MKSRFRPVVKRVTTTTGYEWYYGVLDIETNAVTYTGYARTFKDARKYAKQSTRKQKGLNRANRGAPTTDGWTEV
jgi:hypothetical protein